MRAMTGRKRDIEALKIALQAAEEMTELIRYSLRMEEIPDVDMAQLRDQMTRLGIHIDRSLLDEERANFRVKDGVPLSDAEG